MQKKLSTRIFVALMVTAALLTVSPTTTDVALAQEPSKTTASEAPDFDSLLQTIENEASRTKLLEQLRALAAAQKDATPSEARPTLGDRAVTALATRAKEANEAIVDVASRLSNIPRIADWFTEQVEDDAKRAQWTRLILKLIAAIILATAASWLTRKILAKPRQVIESRDIDSILVKLLFLLGRTVIDLIPIAAATAAAYAILPLTEPSELVRKVLVTMINAYAIAAMIMVVTRMILAPRVQGLRFIPASGETANYLYIWARRFTFAWVYGFFATVAVGLLGLPLSSQRLILILLGLLIVAMAVIFILQNRRLFATFIHTNDDQKEHGHPFRVLRNRLADIWHALAIIYVSAVYLIWALRIEDGFENFLRSSIITVVAIIVTMLISHAIQRAVRKGFSIRSEVKARYPGLEDRANRYLPVLQRMLRALIYLVALIVVLQAWGVDVFSWLESSTGNRIVSAVASIVIVLIVALVVWEGASAAIERYLDKAGEGPMALARRDRARTLLPLLRNVLFFVISVLVILVILSELGVNIGPLLAGAGIAGLAIGFGAQKLVQDVITGAFMLFEDALAVGDVVRVAGTAGRVEAMSIRSLRLRDLSGNVHTIPFSAVDAVTNMTKEFSFYVFEIGIAYRENVDDVIEVLKELGSELQEDENFGPKIIEPLEVLGLDQFGDSAIVIKARFKTLPIEQWAVGREFNRRIKNKFDELGIEIPFPHQTLYFGEDKDGAAPAAPVHLVDGRTPTSDKKSSSESAKPASSPTSTPSSSGQSDCSDGE